jgi:hypothetical protein
MAGESDGPPEVQRGAAVGNDEVEGMTVGLSDCRSEAERNQGARRPWC